ncbi:MAG TPA: hypothetical protein VMU50_17150, partial [Polyangia bacterium]|nr:hypothetical protein [Polyangia bacterium]
MSVDLTGTLDGFPDQDPPAPLHAAAAEDLFVLGRRAADARRARHGERATFVRSKRLLPGGVWRGPRDAA